MTHEQYLAEPARVVDWLLAVRHVEAEVRAEAQEKANREARSGR